MAGDLGVLQLDRARRQPAERPRRRRVRAGFHLDALPRRRAADAHQPVGAVLQRRRPARGHARDASVAKIKQRHLRRVIREPTSAAGAAGGAVGRAAAAGAAIVRQAARLRLLGLRRRRRRLRIRFLGRGAGEKGEDVGVVELPRLVHRRLAGGVDLIGARAEAAEPGRCGRSPSGHRGAPTRRAELRWSLDFRAGRIAHRGACWRRCSPTGVGGPEFFAENRATSPRPAAGDARRRPRRPAALVSYRAAAAELAARELRRTMKRGASKATISVVGVFLYPARSPPAMSARFAVP